MGWFIEWPTEPGLYWFYGWTWVRKGIIKDAPGLPTVEVRRAHAALNTNTLGRSHRGCLLWRNTISKNAATPNTIYVLALRMPATETLSTAFDLNQASISAARAYIAAIENGFRFIFRQLW